VASSTPSWRHGFAAQRFDLHFSQRAAFRARTVSPKGGEGLFVQGGYKGHLSSLGETLVLIDGSGATNSTTTYQAQPSDAQRYLVVSEPCIIRLRWDG
jgi:hypothetical protein